MHWPYKTGEDLTIAGYKCRGFVQCPHCDIQLEIYQIPGEMPVFLNSWDHWPHLVLVHNEEAPLSSHVSGKDAACGPDR